MSTWSTYDWFNSKLSFVWMYYIDLTEDDLNVCTTHIGISFIPTYMKAISVKHTRETDPGHVF